MDRKRPRNSKAFVPLIAMALTGLEWLGKAFTPAGGGTMDPAQSRKRFRRPHGRKWQPIAKANADWSARLKRKRAERDRRKRSLKHRLHARKLVAQ